MAVRLDPHGNGRATHEQAIHAMRGRTNAHDNQKSSQKPPKVNQSTAAGLHEVIMIRSPATNPIR